MACSCRFPAAYLRWRGCFDEFVWRRSVGVQGRKEGGGGEASGAPPLCFPAIM
ncbi:hypothetical protein BU14_0125s0054 [Porphyra umbilicalis]|uniref:Uncharacterized protein n=1 Tax=Porphyra umbilicalis TaxID=2786 RepID=A0A1X6PBE9_PORUM|nr:hypothetical protein BU14_0125s0054 [Porphyra umbilicalis]|eukprot:OSX78066.1 hypothetical protein BU14_0125s0054 [Porphyra umbilicalis]